MFVPPLSQNQEGVGLTTATLLNVEEKLMLAVTDNPVIYNLALKGSHDQYLKSTGFLCNLDDVSRNLTFTMKECGTARRWFF